MNCRKTAENDQTQFLFGWGVADITPEQSVDLAGQHYARVSEGVHDPVTATVLALSSADSAVLMISCDLVSVAECLRDQTRALILKKLPEIKPGCIIMNATHTHTAPKARTDDDERRRMGAQFPATEIELPVMSATDYVAWAAGRIAAAAVTAWQRRAPGSVGYGLGQALVGRNRRSVYGQGTSRMYGNTSAPDFSYIEGYEDHGVNLLGTWNAAGELTGLIVNVACPSQATEHLFEISADYWHETRQELRQRLGANLFVLPQCSAAGDQSPHIQWNKPAEERMLRLTGRSLRQQIAVRIADAVEATLPAMAAERETAPLLRHAGATVELSRRRLSEADVIEALAAAEPHCLEYKRLLLELEQHPEMREQPRWYKPVTMAFRKWRWSANVKYRYDNEQLQPRLPVEVHVIRLGDVAFATNAFELYLDYGIRIKAHSPALQTFLVQLAGGGTYIPSERSVAGKGYGSVPASTPVGPEGGNELVAETLRILRQLWK